MNNEELLKLAEEANFFVQDGVIYYGNVGLQTCLTKFAALVQRATAEDCAKVCELIEPDKNTTAAKSFQIGTLYCAGAIRTKYQLLHAEEVKTDGN